MATLKGRFGLGLDSRLFGTAGPVASTAIGQVLGRLDVGLVMADLATIQQLPNVVDTPDALHVRGEADLLEWPAGHEGADDGPGQQPGGVSRPRQHTSLDGHSPFEIINNVCGKNS